MPKRGFLGLSLPVSISIVILLLALAAVGFAAGALGRSMLGDLGLSWLSVPQPEPKLPAEVVLHLFGFPITNSILGAWITMIVLVGLAYAVTRRMKLIPDRGQSAFEFLVGWLYDFCRSVAGDKNGRRFFPVVATIFLFVAFNAWLSLIPGFGSIEAITADGEHVHLLRGANTDINLPLALALISFVFVEYFGLRLRGIRYLGKFINVGQFFKSLGHLGKGRFRVGFSGLITGLIDIFVGLLETLSELIRIVSFTFRLFGNMTAGEILLLSASFLVPLLFALPFYGLEMLVGFVQALIFAGLTLVFLTVATTAHGHGAET